jgi:hypothetical protein
MSVFGRAWTWLKRGASNTANHTTEWLENRADELLGLMRLAFGSGSPGEQIGASILLGAAAFGASFITFGATILLVVVFAVTGVIGVARGTYDFVTFTIRGTD